MKPKSDDYWRGLAEGFNRGCDMLDLALGRKPGKRLTWQNAKKALSVELGKLEKNWPEHMAIVKREKE